MRILHITAECYPAAKAGGLGDVAGALPKYLNKSGHDTTVIMPQYQTKWINDQRIKTIFEGRAPFNNSDFIFRIGEVMNKELGYRLLLVDIPGRFDRPGVYIDPWSGYAYWDEMERFFTFQIAVLEWLTQQKKIPQIIHCHDHHTALIPFLITQCFRFDLLRAIPTVLTIHNGEYQGRFPMNKYTTLPAFNLDKIGLLEWRGQLNALATGIKCAWAVTTVSEGYLDELMEYCHGLELLLQHEKGKTKGIINGVDYEVWDPSTDPNLIKNYTPTSFKTGKKANKKSLCDYFELDADRPLISFIGRLVREKGADTIPELIQRIAADKLPINTIVLGTGDQGLHTLFSQLKSSYVGYFDTRLEYNEALAHKIYAGSDFLLMPSRVEPCGLNQMYAMRYGTIPVVRKTGGLADTVIDISEKDGYGFVFDNFDIEQAYAAIKKAVELFDKKTLFNKYRKKVMNLDFSWDQSAGEYINLYNKLNKG